MNDTMMTIMGNVTDTPKLKRTKNGLYVATFRVASTPRRFDRERGTWVDSPTLFVTVSAWRSLAENVAQSVKKGQPVVVQGRYCQREYKKDEQLRTTYELEANTVGHDLSRGTSEFEKVTRTTATFVETDEDGNPSDETDNYLDLDDTRPDDAELEVDLDTGEVRELVPAG